MSTIVMDLEIQDPIIRPEQWDRTDQMKISCCVIYDYETDSYSVFGPNDLDYIRSVIMTSHLVVGYNINKFDLPIIMGVPRYEYKNTVKTYDILAEIWKALGLDPDIFTPAHKGFSLDVVTRHTLKKGKDGKGENAPYLWKSGDVWKLISYCIKDVQLTKELYDFIRQHNYVFGKYNQQVILNPNITTH